MSEQRHGAGLLVGLSCLAVGLLVATFAFLIGQRQAAPPPERRTGDGPAVATYPPVLPGADAFADQLDKRSAERGLEVFIDNGCWQCHAVGEIEMPSEPNDPGGPGPDLAGVGKRLSASEMVQSILEPNAVIATPREDYTNDEGKTRMQSFEADLSTGQLLDLVRFLQQQK